jgi:hypothetical protein
VPVNEITFALPVALLATLMLPVTLPPLAGSNVAANVELWPGAIMVPEDMPLALKPAPEMLMFEIVTLPVPEFVNMTVCMLAVDTATLPKLKLVALALRIEVGEFTVSTAALLVAVPAEFDTPTVNCEALSVLAAPGVV